MPSETEPRPLTDRDLEALAREETWTVDASRGGVVAVAGSRPGVRWFLADLGAGESGFVVAGDEVRLRGATWQAAVLGWTRSAEAVDRAVGDRWVSADAAAFARGGGDHGVLEQLAKLVGEPVLILWGDDSPPPVTDPVISRADALAAMRRPGRKATPEVPKVDVTGPHEGRWHVGSRDLVARWGLASGPEADDAVRELMAREHPGLLDEIDLDSYDDVFSATAATPAPALRLATLLQQT